MLAELPGRIAHGVRSFARDHGGNVAITFALCLVPVILFIGAATDMANAQRVRQQLQDATDSAVLAVARDGLRLTDAQLKPEADDYLKASYRYKQIPYTITKLTFDRATVTAVLDTKVNVPTSFMYIAGIKTVPVTAHAISKGLGFEIAMVLDTSGSMKDYAGTTRKIDALKTASDKFLDAMFGTQTTSQRLSIGIVPFATNVRALPAGSSAPSWLDTGGTSDDFDVQTTSPWAMFSKLKYTKWGGCVMTRNAPYDVDDTAASGSTLIRPWFAPDEPGLKGKPSSDYFNSYLDDDGGNCSGSTWGKSETWLQKRTCKYMNATPSGAGPNYQCSSSAITPLTGTRGTLDSAVDALDADGNTNILEGLMWGWRILSPTAPFTEGKAYTAGNNRKVIILMTDGQNNYGGVGGYSNNDNKSNYFTYGYAKDGHIGIASPDNDTLNAKLDGKTLTACTNAKAKGIVIYTIGFGSGATVSQNLLRSCATLPSYFYQPATSADLQPVFLAIAESINRLRLAQ